MPDRSLASIDRSLSGGYVDFIAEAKLDHLVPATPSDPAAVRDVIAKSMEKKPLEPHETAVLLGAESPELVEEIPATRRGRCEDQPLLTHVS